MNSSPGISIIVPVYNAETTLQKCIDSIINQKYKDYELILVDDGSTDNSKSICDSYAQKDDRILVIHQENKGVSAARNAGLDIAKGHWISFVDSDDYIEPNFYQCDFNDDVDLILFCIKDLDVANNSVRQSVNYSQSIQIEGSALKSFIDKYIDTIIFRAPWAKLFKKELIGSLRFCEDMKVAEDAFFVLDYLSHVHKIAQIRSGSYVFRMPLQSAACKYATPLNKVIFSLNNLLSVYKKVENRFHIRRYGFYSYLGYFKMISSAEWKHEPSKWYGNKEIKSFYRYIWKDLSFKQRIRLLIGFIVRR
jgi:glycosyltransferase involved in cell wall biosynthesis